MEGRQQPAGDGEIADAGQLPYAALLGSVREIVVTCNEDGAVRFINDAVRTLLGYDPSSVVGRNFSEFVHPDDLPSAVDAIARWRGRSGSPRGSLIRVAAVDGTWRTFYYDAVVGDHGELTGRFIVTLTPEGEADRESGTLRATLANEDRIVRLASAFLHVPYEDFDKGLHAALEELSGLEWLTRVTVWMIDGARMRLQASWDAPSQAPRLGLPDRIRIDDFRMLGQLAAGKEVRLTSTTVRDPAFAAERVLFESAGTQSVLAVPMVAGGNVLGGVILESTIAGAELDATHVNSVRSAAAILAAAFLRRDAERELAERARMDQVTGLANRWAFTAELEHAIGRLADGQYSAVDVAMIDIDRFKLVNDSVGHLAGDRLLAEVAVRLTGVAPDDMLLARLGGDEYLAMIPNLPDGAAAVEEVKDLLAMLAVPFEVGASTMALTASAGVVHLTDGRSAASEALRWVDLAVSKAKQSGGDTIEVFDPIHAAAIPDRMRRVADLQRGLADGELLPHFQGEWDLTTGELVGAEALVRWQHPTEGLLGAVEFVSLAESSGLISQLGSQVLSSACREAAKWVALRSPGSFVLRVNVSAQQLRGDELDEIVADVLADSGLPAEALCLELTESSLLADPARSAALFARLRAMGVGLAIDDFGTGYSSFVQLKRLPLTAIKIDQTFVAGLPDDKSDRAIVRASLDLAEALAIDATAEGVETEEQRAALVALGCRRAQGYLLARPESAGDFTLRLREATETP